MFLSAMVSTSMQSQDGWAPTGERIRLMISVEVIVFSLGVVSRLVDAFPAGIFAGTNGTQRLLKMFAKYDIRTTWFIPGHSLDTFPDDMAAVRDAGHEIGLHGYSHENPSDMTLEQQRIVLDKTYRQLTEFAGKPPRGSVAPW